MYLTNWTFCPSSVSDIRIRNVSRLTNRICNGKRYISELSVCQLKTNRGKYENHFFRLWQLGDALVARNASQRDADRGQVYSHTPENAQQLAALLGCPWTTDPETVDTDADLYVFSLKDTVLADVIARVRPNEGLWVHTAGSMPMDVFNGHTANYGVLYPMQTFSKTREVDFNVIPFFLEANTSENAGKLQHLAEKLSGNIHFLSSDKRKSLHLAAVFACNFTNHIYALAVKLLEDRIYRLMSCCHLSTRRQPRYIRCRRGWHRLVRLSDMMRM